MVCLQKKRKNTDFLADLVYENELYHHGILGQKWGIRRFQNKDGSLTDEGRKRYLTTSGSLNEEGQKKFIDLKNGKYSRKLALLGAPIDLVRAYKAKKQAEENEKAKQQEKETAERERSDQFDSEMDKAGWVVTKSESPYGYTWIENEGKMGDKDVNFSAEYIPSKIDKDPNTAVKQITDTKKKFEQEYKKVLSTAREAVAKDMYDSGLFDEWNADPDVEFHGMSRQDFKDALKLSSVILYANDSNKSANATLVFNDGKDLIYLMGDHIFDMEYDIDNDKVYGGVRLEG